MEELEKPKHEIFARLVAEGSNYTTAYQQVFACSKSWAKKAGYRLARQPAVAARITALQQTAARAAGLHMADRLNFLKDLILTPVDQIDASSPLCLGRRHTAHGIEFKTTDKLRAIELYSRLAGDFPQRPHQAAPPPSTPSPLEEIRNTPDEIY